MLATALWTLLALVLVVGSLAVLRANRLDRLHARADAAASALRAVLDRRAEVARAVAAALALPPAFTAPLYAAANAAQQAGPDDREAAENGLTAQLGRLVTPAGLPPDLADDLADAQQRLVMARRVHNDAVRDALALRGTWLVRRLRLAGTAQAPRYFEITEPEPLDRQATEPVQRPAARVLLLDGTGRVLLFEGFDPARPHEPFWFTVGGAVEPGEPPRAAALRELREETGLALADDQLTGPVWQRDVLFSFHGRPYSSRELFFVARTSEPHVDTSGFDDLETQTVLGHRWWSVEELRDTTAVVYPLQLAELLPTVADDWDGQTLTVR